MGTEYECDTAEEFSRRLKEYWIQVRQSEGFDIENVSGPVGMTGLLYFDCQLNNFYPDRAMIKQYAQLGLHRYNMLEGTSLELSALMKFNMLQNVVSSYYITLVAYDPDSLSFKDFQVRVDEKKYGSLDLVVSVARLKQHEVATTTTKNPFMPHFYGDAMATPFFQGDLPPWPSYDDLNDKNRFYVLKESEWLDIAWIPLYLETLVYANDRNISDRDLSKLEIINVAIETEEEDVNERVEAKSAHVYITFKGLAESFFGEEPFKKKSIDAQRLGEQFERKAILRRVISRGALSLMV